MTIADLKRAVLEANLELVERGLVFDTFGNASGVERDLGVMVIKPSGVPYGKLSVDDMAVVALESGDHVAGLRPSSDTPTHLEIYRAFATAGRSRSHPLDERHRLGASAPPDPVFRHHARRLLLGRRALQPRPHRR